MIVSRTRRTRIVDIEQDLDGAQAALKRSHGHDRRGKALNRTMRAIKAGWQAKEMRRFRTQVLPEYEKVPQ